MTVSFKAVITVGVDNACSPKQVLVAASINVVDTVGLMPGNSRPAMSAPMSTEAPALMLMSANAGRHVSFVEKPSPIVISGMLIRAPAKAVDVGDRPAALNSTPACTLSWRANVKFAGTSVEIGRRVVVVPLLIDVNNTPDSPLQECYRSTYKSAIAPLKGSKDSANDDESGNATWKPALVATSPERPNTKSTENTMPICVPGIYQKVSS